MFWKANIEIAVSLELVVSILVDAVTPERKKITNLNIKTKYHHKNMERITALNEKIILCNDGFLM